MLVVVVEACGDLSPVVALFFVDIGVPSVFAGVFKPAAVPVYVEDGIHAVGHNVAHYFIHAVEPCGVDGVVGGVAHVAVPRAGDAHCVESDGFQACDVFLFHTRRP